MMQTYNPPTLPTVIAPQPPPKKHKFIPGTQRLSGWVANMGSRKFLAAILLVATLLIGFCGYLVDLLGPLAAQGLNGIGDYQPEVYTYTGLLGVPGEIDAQGNTHKTTVIFEYTDHLMIIEIPAGNSARETITDAPAQIAKHPRIAGFQWTGKTGTSSLEVQVEPDNLQILSATFTFTFSNHLAEMSADPTSAGYHVVQFQYSSVSEG